MDDQDSRATDVIGRPYVLMLTAGNISDVKAAPVLLERAGRMCYLLSDKGYDADRLRRSLRDAGAVPVIAGRRNRKRTIRYDKDRYRARHLIENAFCRLKDLRRVATRYDKLAANFLSGVAVATALAFWLCWSLSLSTTIFSMGRNNAANSAQCKAITRITPLGCRKHRTSGGHDASCASATSRRARRVSRFGYQSHGQLRTHLADFMAAYNFARQLKTLIGLTPYEYITKISTSEPDRFIVYPIHQMQGTTPYASHAYLINPML